MKEAAHKCGEMSDVEDASGEQGGFTAEPQVVLVLGAAAASTVVTIRPALAQTAGSVLACEIPIPAPNAAGSFISDQGDLVPAGTPGAHPPLPRPLKGEEAKQLLRSGHHAAGRRCQCLAGLCQLHSPSAVGDERLHLLRLAADAAVTKPGP